MISGCAERNSTGAIIYSSPSERDSVTHQSEDIQMANVVISNDAFYPSSLIISKGTTVVWTNEDSTEHTIDSDVGHVDSDEMPKGGTYSVIFNRSGTYTYHSGAHLSMKGKIIVQ